jgi:hypothetical protein
MVASKMALGRARRLLGALCFSALLGGGVATAAPITFTDVHDVPGSGFQLNTNNRNYSFTHNIVNPAGDPQGDIYSALTDILNSATITLNFDDDDFDILGFNSESIFLQLDGNSQSNFEVDSGDISFAVNVALLALDGLLNVNVKWVSGDIRFDESMLVVNGTRSAEIPTGRVPEPSSLMLLGAGLLGSGILARKRLKHKF